MSTPSDFDPKGVPRRLARYTAGPSFARTLRWMSKAQGNRRAATARGDDRPRRPGAGDRRKSAQEPVGTRPSGQCGRHRRPARRCPRPASCDRSPSTRPLRVPRIATVQAGCQSRARALFRQGATLCRAAAVRRTRHFCPRFRPTPRRPVARPAARFRPPAARRGPTVAGGPVRRDFRNGGVGRHTGRTSAACCSRRVLADSLPLDAETAEATSTRFAASSADRNVIARHRRAHDFCACRNCPAG